MNGHRFVVTISGTIKLVQNYSVKSWAMTQVNFQVKAPERNIRLTPLGLANAMKETSGRNAEAVVTITRSEELATITKAENVTNTKV